MIAQATPAITIVNEIHRPLYHLYLRSDGIVVRISHDDAWFTINDVRDFVETMHKITNGVPHLLLSISGKRSSIDKEARSFLASNEGLKDVKALAAVIKSIPQRIIANLILLVDKPSIPLKFFADIESAETWLRDQQ